MKPSRVLALLILISCFFSFSCNDMSLQAPKKGADIHSSTKMDMSRDQFKAGEKEHREGLGNQEDIPALIGRKIIREANVSMRVKDLDESREELNARVLAAGGFIANVNFNRLGAHHVLHMTLRLPSDGFVDFIGTLDEMGVILNEQIGAQDVTDQWVDLGRRIATKEKLASRLEELIRNKSYQFRDLLEVERELARLRLEIEQLQGTLRGLDDRIALSTLHLELRQEVNQKVVAPDSVFAPLINAIENAGPRLQSSFRALLAVFAAMINLVIFVLPWLIPFFLILLTLKLIIRRSKAKALNQK